MLETQGKTTTKTKKVKPKSWIISTNASDIPRQPRSELTYVTVRQEFDTMNLFPGWTYRKIIFRTDGNNLVASAGDLDWFRHWPLWARIKFCFGMLFGKRMYPQ